MKLQSLPTRTDRKFKRKRLGRGYGSKVGGHTVGRGHKGQKSRSGHKSMVMFEGGNRPFFSRIPKLKGFKRPNTVQHQPVNVQLLSDHYDAGEVVSVETLKEKGLIRKNTVSVKILGLGVLDKKLVIQGLDMSSTAREKVVSSKSEIVD